MIRIEIEQDENSDAVGASFKVVLTHTIDGKSYAFRNDHLSWDEAASEVSRLISIAAGKVIGSFDAGHLGKAAREWGRWVSGDASYDRLADDERVAHSQWDDNAKMYRRLILKRDWVLVGQTDIDGTPRIVKATRAER